MPATGWASVAIQPCPAEVRRIRALKKIRRTRTGSPQMRRIAPGCDESHFPATYENRIFFARLAELGILAKLAPTPPPLAAAQPNATYRDLLRRIVARCDECVLYGRFAHEEPMTPKAIARMNLAVNADSNLAVSSKTGNPGLTGFPDAPDPGFLRGPVFEDDRQEIVFLSLSLSVQPLNPEAYLQRGMAHGRRRDPHRAIADYDRFLALAASGTYPAVRLATRLSCTIAIFHVRKRALVHFQGQSETAQVPAGIRDPWKDRTSLSFSFPRAC
jgi:hypothetical protein